MVTTFGSGTRDKLLAADCTRWLMPVSRNLDIGSHVKGSARMRYLLPILGLLLLVGALGGIKFKQISSLIQYGKAAEAAGPPPEAVGTDKAETLSWEGTLSAVGSVVAERGVTVSNEVPGVVTRIRFESGDTVKTGQVLVEIDASIERAALATALARRELAFSNVQRTRKLAESATITAAKVDQDENQLKTADAEIAQLQAQIDRKTVRAAFSGKLGIREVNLGQYLNPGTELTTLESLDSVFVDFTLPQQTLQDVTIGLPVNLKVSGEQALEASGSVAAVDPSIDNTTRTIRVRASVPNPGQKLRPGMFVDVKVVLPTHGAVIAIPVTAVVHASYGDSVFVVEEPKDPKPSNPPGVPVKVARQQFVRLGEARGDFVAVLEGVKPGEEVVTAGAFKLRNGSPVIVNNSVKPGAKVVPTPENR
jgi:membrane fusion protein (multidrug efflux system)